MPATSKNIAAIDIGTNSIHLVVAEVNSQEHIHVIDTDKLTLRLGSHLDQDGNLTELAIQRTVQALKQMNEICRSYDAYTRLVATHAFREAKNRHEVIERIQEETGLYVEVIDGLEEARLIYLGIVHGLPSNMGRVLAVDIGGGSTEIILGVNESFKYLTSLKLGAVVLSKKYLESFQKSSNPKKELIDFVDLRLAPMQHELHHLEHDVAVMSSGTAKAMFSVYYKKFLGEKTTEFNGRSMPGTEVRKIMQRFLDIGTPKDIEQFSGLSDSRSEIIMAGSVILDRITELLGIKNWIYSEFALREGMVIDTHRRMQNLGSTQPANIQFRWERLVSLAQRLRIDEEHAKEVMDVGNLLLPKIWPLLRLDPAARDAFSWAELFQGASFLHEVGKIISFPKFHLHSEYILQHSRVLGFTEDERVLIGLIILYHRKGLKIKSSDSIYDFDAQIRKVIMALAAVLRFASAACRLRENRIVKLDMVQKNQELYVLLMAKDQVDLTIELKKLDDDREIYEKSWGYPVHFMQEKTS